MALTFSDGRNLHAFGTAFRLTGGACGRVGWETGVEDEQAVKPVRTRTTTPIDRCPCTLRNVHRPNTQAFADVPRRVRVARRPPKRAVMSPVDRAYWHRMLPTSRTLAPVDALIARWFSTTRRPPSFTTMPSLTDVAR